MAGGVKDFLGHVIGNVNRSNSMIIIEKNVHRYVHNNALDTRYSAYSFHNTECTSLNLSEGSAESVASTTGAFRSSLLSITDIDYRKVWMMIVYSVRLLVTIYLTS